ncbi:glycosyltransferase [Jeotgalibacillus terrae]|uniref:Glycosyltransferase n=1 Tax=Jeotgalibacillus terrae TaxID=587735 RepID=A0ABW5ZIV8_9BACL|nr:glycosyltransferase family 2 protein [Jeotgalibacillus terrae]MBM7577349.1 cellulose synthase/poly-beta-1,6-N-acetylglucosamine synthase-like glycosyltransferase [Jeotgalibacillus terrae]
MIIYIFILLLFLFVTIINVLTMPRLKKAVKNESFKVSFLIPMRNEEKNVKGIIDSVLRSDYHNREVIVLNDQSEDRTAEVLSSYGDSIKVINGRPLPEGWVGKVHACHQLSKEANGDFLCFIDADVRLDQHAVSRALYLLKKKNASLITGFPKFPAHSFLAKLLVPLQHFFVFFHLPNFMANYTKLPAFTAAHGAFMLFEKEAYFKSGGHESVKRSLVEDIHITRHLKSEGYTCILSNVSSHITCDMYETNREVWEGFSKNIFTGLGRNVPAALAVSVFYLCFYFLPLPLAITGIMVENYIWIVPLMIVFLQTFVIDLSTGQTKFHFLYMPLSAIALVILLLASMSKSLTGKGYTWKGRTYN